MLLELNCNPETPAAVFCSFETGKDAETAHEKYLADAITYLGVILECRLCQVVAVQVFEPEPVAQERELFKQQVRCCVLYMSFDEFVVGAVPVIVKQHEAVVEAFEHYRDL